MSKKIKPNSIKGSPSNTLFKYFKQSPSTNKENKTASPATAASAASVPEKNEDIAGHQGRTGKRKFHNEIISDNINESVSLEGIKRPKLDRGPKRRILLISSDEDESGTENTSNDHDTKTIETKLEAEKKSLVKRKEGAVTADKTDEMRKSFCEKWENVKNTDGVQEPPLSAIASGLSKQSKNDEANYVHDREGDYDDVFPFLKPENIRDSAMVRPGEPGYDPTSLHIPAKFFCTLTPAMRQWWQLKQHHYDCVLFFKMGKFYELFHMDADVGVKELGFTYMRGDFRHAGFPERSFDKMASILIDRGYKVARVEQTETVEQMDERCKSLSQRSGGSKIHRVVTREICQISNRGTRLLLPQCQISLNHEPNYLLAIIEKVCSQVTRFGIAFIDTTIGQFHLGEFDDDINCSRLLTLLSHNMPVLVLTERSNLGSQAKIVMRTMLGDVLKEELQPASQSADKTFNVLADKYFTKESGLDLPVVLAQLQSEVPQKELLLRALSMCIGYLEKCMLTSFVMPTARYVLYTPTDVEKATTHEAIAKLPKFMVLDSTTLHNLNIITLNEQHKQKSKLNLLATLDHCVTKFGKRLLHSWLCAPSCEISVIRGRQEVISAFLLESSNSLEKMRSLFSTLPDLERNLAQIQLFGNKFIKRDNHPDSRAILFEETLYNKKKIKTFLSTLKSFDALSQQLTKIFTPEDVANAPLLRQLTCLNENGGKFPNLSEEVTFFLNAFDHDMAEKQGIIEPNPGTDVNFDEIQAQIATINDELNRYLKKQEKFFGCSLKYVGTDKKRYQIEVPDKNAIKANKEYTLTSQRKGFKRYSTEETRNFLINMRNAEKSNSAVLLDVSRRLFEKFSSHYSKWTECVECVAALDVLSSLAIYASSQNCICVPKLSVARPDEQPFLRIEDGYHPFINLNNFIPNGMELGTEQKAPLVILTGANMGGKSTIMREIGLLVVMAQIGAHVPAVSYTATLVDRIFTRVGAADDIMAGQSTFLVEMSETAHILQHATKHSLVLFDELGRGTGSTDGFAIATSVLDYLGNLKCRCIFSTHYHHLVHHFDADPRVTLGHMACMVENEDDDNPTYENVTFLYKYVDGCSPKSYGFHTAKLAALPTPTIKRAYEISQKFDKDIIRRQLTQLVVKCAVAGKLDVSQVKELLYKLKK